MATRIAGTDRPARAGAEHTLRLEVAAVSRLALGLGVAAVLGAGAVSSAAAQPAAAGDPAAAPVAAPTAPDEHDTYRAVLDRYCVACHNERTLTANLALDTADIAHVGDAAEVWEKVLEKLRTRAMPPPRRPRPADETYDRFAGWLEDELDGAAAARPDPGRPTIHRLNRLEYANAVRDLLGLTVDVDAMLPADDLAYGFDNNADILTIAPGMLERYMSAARRIGRLAVGDSAIDADVVRYPVSSLLVQRDRMSEEMPFGSRGGASVTHHFPLDGEYVVGVTLQGNGGRREPQEIDVRIDGVRAALLRAGQGMRGGATRGMPTGDDSLAVRVPVRAGTRVVSVSFLKRTGVTEGVAPERLPLWTFSAGRGYVEPMALDSVEIEGPYRPRPGSGGPGTGPAVSRDRIFTCRPEGPAGEEACANAILTTLARRAFRRPVTAGDLEVLDFFYREGRRAGGFEGGVQRAIESLLVDPEFLFRIERDPERAAPGSAYRLSDVELASRLSFFLWSSIPDDELLHLAEAGRLRDPAVLEQQVRRMLTDERSRVLVDSFAAQWLHLRRMRTVTPDVLAFPGFDDNLRDALVRETELFVESQIREDRSVVNLLTADYTFVNERLARHYGIPGVYGSRFRRVALGDGARRGLLGHGSILTVTSLATRTSPVVRGKWVLENILGTPPPPPPPDVPDLPEREAGEAPRSMRARLEAHRANPACSACHARMDPLGFALEHFDAVGKWRDAEGGVPVDASGALPDGTTFDGLPGLRYVLLGRQDEFVTTVAEKLLTYALGRGIEHYDRPAIRAIVRDAAADGHRWSSLVLGVARSLPFQMRRAES
ncbi:MAG: DUF1592 domain-containing protein [Acidobacteria bacterium]|nr:DUF1592 domain-containing protein [Acidobacteriota bacterium]